MVSLTRYMILHTISSTRTHAHLTQSIRVKTPNMLQTGLKPMPGPHWHNLLIILNFIQILVKDNYLMLKLEVKFIFQLPPKKYVIFVKNYYLNSKIYKQCFFLKSKFYFKTNLLCSRLQKNLQHFDFIAQRLINKESLLSIFSNTSFLSLYDQVK